MGIVRITDPADPRLRDYVSLTDVALRSRHEPTSGIYIAESAEVIRRAVEAGHRPRSLLMQDTWVDRLTDLIDSTDVDVFVGSRDVLEGLTGFTSIAGHSRRCTVRSCRASTPSSPTRAEW